MPAGHLPAPPAPRAGLGWVYCFYASSPTSSIYRLRRLSYGLIAPFPPLPPPHTCTVDVSCSPAASTASAAVRCVREKGDANTSTRLGGCGRADSAARSWRLERKGGGYEWRGAAAIRKAVESWVRFSSRWRRSSETSCVPEGRQRLAVDEGVLNSSGCTCVAAALILGEVSCGRWWVQLSGGADAGPWGWAAGGQQLTANDVYQCCL